MKNALCLLFVLLSGMCFAAEDDTIIVRKEVQAVRTANPIKTDGLLEDSEWKDVPVASNFIQNSPQEGAPVSFDTEVKIRYDNSALYIGAKMYDNYPDSIYRQLGLRDNYLNADNFRVVFDTYNTQLDAFDFSVTASGIQSDSRFSDMNYNAVWRSAVQIQKDGWTCEIAIPWAALRFPTGNGHDWGIQFTRNIQRKFEFDQWALTPKGKANPLKYWGLLKGLENVDVPVRLSLTPYLTTIWQNDNRFGPDDPSLSFSGGLDLKYGINESFTLDMTLLPDFSQVQSDNIVKNLGAFEVQFQDFRPFFNEGVDLFQRGNLFYSRRIGKTPAEFYNAPYLTNPNEVIIKNPTRARLLNATKLSGRTNSGMGLGILNAFVDNTYAIAQDTLTGTTRKILTEPRSNYNIFVIDKQLPHSSSIYFINTNVIRTNGYRSSNVSGAGFQLNNKTNTWSVSGNGAVSDILYPNSGNPGEFTSDIGYKYDISVDKTGGTWQYGARREVLSKRWDADDLGITFENNYAAHSVYAGYYLFNPKWIFNFANSNLNIYHQMNLENGALNNININLFNYFQFRNFWSTYVGIDLSPIDSRDYWEPRVAGRYYLRAKYGNIFFGVNSNSSKKLFFNLNAWGGRSGYISPTIPINPWGGGGLDVTWRATDRFMIRTGMNLHTDWGDRGWVNIENDGAVIFGRRNIRNIELNGFAQYVFMKDMTLSLQLRHYWATGNYLSYYILQDDGTLNDYVTYNRDHDFSFNSINVDLIYQWIFAPGSILSVSYKLNTMTEENFINYNYMYNLNHSVNGPQLNQVSVRVLYFLDYHTVKESLKRNKK